jgi:hypothetical protein
MTESQKIALRKAARIPKKDRTLPNIMEALAGRFQISEIELDENNTVTLMTDDDCIIF